MKSCGKSHRFSLTGTVSGPSPSPGAVGRSFEVSFRYP